MNTSNNSPLGDGGMGIFLIGFMGSGKTHWGNIWSQQSGLPFYDLDGVIEEQQQQTIAQIFEQDGEPFFRHIEAETLRYFEDRQSYILSCGGGTPCYEHNMDWMNENGTTIYLKATPQELTSRLIGEQDKRPLIKNLSPQQLLSFVENKLKEREKFYSKAKHILPVGSLQATTITTLL